MFYALQGLIKTLYMFTMKKDHLSEQMNINIDFMQKIYMLVYMSHLVLNYVLLLLSAAIYVEVLGSWMLMIAAFMLNKQYNI
jgi:hypothetical protein